MAVGDDDVLGDAALMTRVARADADAFRVLVTRHTPLVHRLAWRMLGGADAEDVVQEVFTKLWVGAPRWTNVGAKAGGGGGVPAWLRRSATNACLDRLRRRRFVADEDVPERADDAPPVDQVIDADRRRAAVAAAIGRLPDTQRAAIVLTYHEDLSNAEAAAILGIKVKAMESLLVRARQGLTRALAADGLIEEGAR